MRKKYTTTLEFDKIKLMLADFAISENTKSFIDKLGISTEPKMIKTYQAETSEAQKIILQRGAIPFRAFFDVRLFTKKAGIGSTLDTRALLQIAQTISTARVCKAYIEQFQEIPHIQNLAEQITVLKDLEDEIFSKIISETQISDNASANLRRIRRSIEQENQNIKNKISSMLNSSAYSSVLQDSIVTIRNDRFVLPVKAENKNALDGIVHDTSSSGATLFVEPMAIVNMNNKLSQLKNEEHKEIEKILQKLTAEVGQYFQEINDNLKALEKLDFINAKGRLSVSMEANEPQLNNEKYVNLIQARHPLIPKDKVVSSNIILGKDYTTLIITGPNTGGKTVTLKTLGLLCMMFQAGLHIPCQAQSTLPVFNDIYADIGDEQSIEQSLSTFSSHISNIVNILKFANKNSLVLIDELGSGTDPIEGSALAISILDELKRRSVLTLVTTHFSELKNYALTTDGVINASVEFDVATLSPTYRLTIGLPGKSNAFEISKKLGISDEIIADAKKHIQNDNLKMEDILSQIDKVKNDYETDKENLEKELEDAKFIRMKLENKQQRLEEKNKAMLEEAKEQARKMIADAKQEADKIAKQITKLQHMSAYKEVDKQLNNIRTNIRGYENKYQKAKQELVKKSETPLDTVKEGDTVYVNSFAQNAKVISVDEQKDEIVVQIGAIKMPLKKENLSPAQKQKEKKATKSAKISKNKVESARLSCDVRGLDLESALLEVDKYIDDSYLAQLPEVTIIHGVGTLVLKNGIQNYLRKHNHIKSFRDGEYNEGGIGVTVATLK